MKVLNYGSLNIDYVYIVDHLAEKGETIKCNEFQEHCGGKGLNQSIALASAGMEVYHAGRVGKDGQILIDCLQDNNVCTDYVILDENHVSGHAIIQVEKSGQNNIIVYGGANHNISVNDIDMTLSAFTHGDYILLQNEINEVDYIIQAAKQKGMKIIFNPAPIDSNVKFLPLDQVDILIVNEVEGFHLTGQNDPDLMLRSLVNQFVVEIIVLTLGANGSILYENGKIYKRKAENDIHVVDTTAAGDTFIGYLVFGLSEGYEISEVLDLATRASSYCIGKVGAASSIPKIHQLV